MEIKSDLKIEIPGIWKANKASHQFWIIHTRVDRLAVSIIWKVVLISFS